MKKILILFPLLLGLDLAAKYLVVTYMELHQTIPVIHNFFSLHYVENSGAAFGIFANGTLFLIMVGMLVLSFVIYAVIKVKTATWWVALTYALLLAGIAGNLFDRIFNGAVVDYLAFSLSSFHFPVFNLADSFIILAVGSLIISELKKKDGDAHV